MTAPRQETIERDDDPIPLSAACDAVFRGAVSPATLRAAARRGELVITRYGRRDFTTLADVRQWVRSCRDRARDPGSIGTLSVNAGSSETERCSTALVAAQAMLDELKERSRTTSDGSTSRSPVRRRQFQTS